MAMGFESMAAILLHPIEKSRPDGRLFLFCASWRVRSVMTRYSAALFRVQLLLDNCLVFQGGEIDQKGNGGQ